MEVILTERQKLWKKAYTTKHKFNLESSIGQLANISVLFLYSIYVDFYDGSNNLIFANDVHQNFFDKYQFNIETGSKIGHVLFMSGYLGEKGMWYTDPGYYDMTTKFKSLFDNNMELINQIVNDFQEEFSKL